MQETQQTKLKSIKQLNLQQCRISKQNIEQFTGKQWDHLQNLWMWGNNLDDSCADEIFEKSWPKLTMIRLTKNKITDRGFQKFKPSNFPSLTKLYIAKNLNVTLTGMRPILEPSSNLSKLQVLEISQSQIGSKGVKLLVKSEYSHLEELMMAQCGIGSEGMKHLSKGKWPALRVLILNANKCKGVQNSELMSQSAWKRLRKFNDKREHNDYTDSIGCMEMAFVCWKEIEEATFDVENQQMRVNLKQIMDDVFN